MKYRIPKIILCIFIFITGLFIGLFSGKIYKYFSNIFSYQPVAIEVSGDDFPVDYNYLKEENHRIFHGNSYIEKYGKIFFESKELKDVDTETFQYFTGSYARDKNNYYFGEKKVHISDGISEIGYFDVGKDFEILVGDYAKDERYLYYQDYGFLTHQNQEIKIIPENSNYKNFLQIGDKIFYGHQEQRHIDHETFSYLKYNYFQDKHGIYFGNELLPLSKKNFEIIDKNFIKDDRNIFLHGKYYPNVDAKTFRKLKGDFPQNYFEELFEDKNGYYTIGAYLHNFYEITENTSKADLEKCFQNEELCSEILGY